MKFDARRRGISPIIATLLLIAIAVAAGIIVYVYVNGLAGSLTGSGGSQVAQQLQVQAYAFYPIGASGFTTSGTSGSGQVADIFLKNVGGSSVQISGVYFDGTPLTEWGTSASGTYAANGEQVPTSLANCYMLVSTATTFSVSTSATTIAGATTACTGSASTCTSPSFCLVPNSTTETGGSTGTALAAQGTDQLVIGMFTSQTQASSHTVKVVTTTGAQFVFTVVVGRTG